jgi:hypothetical protein
VPITPILWRLIGGTDGKDGTSDHGQDRDGESAGEILTADLRRPGPDECEHAAPSIA